MGLIKTPRRRINISLGDIKNSLVSILLRKFNDGKEIDEFEEKFANYMESKYVTCTYSGKQALYIILKSLNLKDGEEVILPSYTASSVPRTVIYSGLKPIFTDVDIDTFNIDVNLLKKNITKKTKAIIVTHVHGLPSDMEKIEKICKENNIFLIEDCAHALGASYKNKKVGTFGIASFFSLGPGKHLSNFGGGVILTNDETINKKSKEYIRNCRYPNRFESIKKIFRVFMMSIFSKPIIFSIAIYPFIRIFGNKLISKSFETKINESKNIPNEYKKKFINAQAIIALNKLKLINEYLRQRIENGDSLRNKLKKSKIKIQQTEDFVQNTYLDFPILIKNRNKVIKELLKKGIDTQSTWLENCSDIKFFNSKNISKNAEILSKNVIYVPIDNKKTVEKISTELKKLQG